MTNLSLLVIPAKILTDGTHKIRILISHKHETLYITTRFSIDSLDDFKNDRVVSSRTHLL